MTSPDPPKNLLKASRDRWAAFWASDAAAAVDVAADMGRLVRWVEQTDEYDRVAKVCRASRLVRGSMGQPVLNPLFSYLAQLETQISRAETEFGMSPLARSRLRLEAPEPAVETELDRLRERRARRTAG